MSFPFLNSIIVEFEPTKGHISQTPLQLRCGHQNSRQQEVNKRYIFHFPGGTFPFNSPELNAHIVVASMPMRAMSKDGGDERHLGQHYRSCHVL